MSKEIDDMRARMDKGEELPMRVIAPFIQPRRHVCRVAIVWSSSSPTKKVTWLAHSEGDIKRVQNHSSFVRWLTADIQFNETDMKD